MNLRKQNRTVAAILYAVLSVVIVVVLCLSVFQLMQGEKKGTTPKVPSATQKAESTQATVPSNEQTQAPAQTSETMATPATDATTATDPAQTQPPSAPTSSTVQTFVMPITGGTISKAFRCCRLFSDHERLPYSYRSRYIRTGWYPRCLLRRRCH